MKFLSSRSSLGSSQKMQMASSSWAPSMYSIRQGAPLSHARREGGRVLGMPVRHRNDPHLLGSEPEGKGPGVVLDEHAGESLDRTEDGPMDHHGTVPHVVLAHVLHVEALRQRE